MLVAGGTITSPSPTRRWRARLIIIDDGDIELHSADDGVNVATSDDSAATDGAPDRAAWAAAAWRPTRRSTSSSTAASLEVWASGDGLDSNGYATITGGDITVYGPTTDGNGALDVNGTFEITGGTLMADRQLRDDGRPVDRLRAGLARDRARRLRPPPAPRS